MFGPDYKAGCPSCSAIADGFDGFAVHLANHDVMLSAVSLAPLEKLQAYEAAHGVDVSLGVVAQHRLQLRLQRSVTEAQQREGGVEYNYRRPRPAQTAKPEAEAEGPAALAAVTGTDVAGYMPPAARG